MLRIKELIKIKGYTQEEFAEKLGMTRSALTQHLMGKPSYSTLEKIAQGLNVEIWELFTPSTCKEEAEIIALIEYEGKFYKFERIKDLKEFADTLELKKESKKQDSQEEGKE